MAFVWYSTPVARTITFCSDKTAVAIYPVDDKYARIWRNLGRVSFYVSVCLPSSLFRFKKGIALLWTQRMHRLQCHAHKKECPWKAVLFADRFSLCISFALSVKNKNKNIRSSRAHIFFTTLLSWKNIVIGGHSFRKTSSLCCSWKKNRISLSLLSSRQDRVLVIRVENIRHISTWQYMHRLSIPVSRLAIIVYKKSCHSMLGPG